MVTFTKDSYENLWNNATDTQKNIINKVVKTWNDKEIVIDDIEFTKLPANYQTRLTRLITRLGYF